MSALMAGKKDDKNSGAPPWEGNRRKQARGWFRKILGWGAALALVAAVVNGMRAKPVEVETAAIRRGGLTVFVTEEGKTRIRNRYTVSAPVAGQMGRVTLRAGDEVKAAETVITVIEPGIPPLLDPRRRAQALAAVDAAEASRQRAMQGLDLAKTDAQFALTNWNRIKATGEKGALAANDRDNYERAAEMKQREVRSAEFAVQVAEFELAQAKAALMSMEGVKAGESVEVRAPVSGRVLKVLQESSVVVSPGTAIIEIGDPADLEIEAEILSRDAVGIKLGAEVSVEEWGDDAPLQARVRRIEPAAFTKVSALGVEEQRVLVLCDLVKPPAAAAALGDRYRVEVRIAVWHEDSTLLAPSGALFREGSEWRAFVPKDGIVHAVPVEAGRTDGRSIQVLSGLAEGSEVLLHPPDTVTDGSMVVVRRSLP
ncbi:MAG: HlyD family efflux transporter periplasmic adaptor subunit [Verrucomicrobiales bacterium]|nr:HlyD family efflux transporter periplasmic adaptor subunit [Verrucomicrobiales bacterium]